MKYWLKGGFILSGIFWAIIFINYIIMSFNMGCSTSPFEMLNIGGPNCSWGFQNSSVLINSFEIFIQILLFLFLLAILSIPFFLIGALIGRIISKIKSSKRRS